jgi:DNA-binding MarR family transcriptional regulator
VQTARPDRICPNAQPHTATAEPREQAELTPPISQSIRAALNRKTLATVRHRAALARHLGLVDSDVLAILHLARAGQLTPGQLGDLLRLTTGGTAALLQRLERAGHVTRAPHPRDGRSTVLRLTGDAEERAGEAFAPLVSQLDALVEELEPDEQRVVERFLLRVADATEAQAEELVRRVDAEAADAHAVPAPGLWA